jgi:mRNA interferase MazF
MGVPTAGSVVVIPFPFSDLSQAKRRPAVVLADAGKDDAILCMITTNAYADPGAIRVDAPDFVTGSLRQISYMRPGKLFTAHESLMSAPIAELAPATFKRLRDAVVKMISP